MSSDRRTEVLRATGELLLALAHANSIEPEMLAGIHFTTTPDLTSEYPALAARKLGWLDVPLLCGHEMDVAKGIPRCIRVMALWNTTLEQKQIRHIYLRKAIALRPDRQDLDDIPDFELPEDFEAIMT